MKKLFLILSMMLSTTALFAQAPQGHGNGQPMPIKIKPPHQGDIHHPIPKSPIEIPEVWQDGHALYFDEAIEGCLVLLVDEDENVVFSDSIGENQIALTFPSTLTGTFELQIIQGNIIFYCEIEL